ncbi:Guanosine-diphosphatase [Terramyces sp. JEL0728]|nr:Guanosine-diphosphatase [Terramyces sp. JEL0728]
MVFNTPPLVTFRFLICQNCIFPDTKEVEQLNLKAGGGYSLAKTRKIKTNGTDIVFLYLLFSPTNLGSIKKQVFARVKTDKCGIVHKGMPDIQYAIVIDAGSRIHVYRFNYCNQAPELEDEVFIHTKPGLSSYVTDPKAAADSLDKLLKDAVANVPVELHKCTPIAVKATAGLRMLENGMGEIILKQVEQKLKTEYPFPLIKEGAVEIMGGDDEGAFAWITINYLLGNIGGRDKKPTVGIMDLGGGSTQIVFEPSGSMHPGSHKKELKFSGHDYVLYQHSYDGYGLMQGRLKIKKASKSHAPCLPEGKTSTLENEGTLVELKGTGTDFDQCYSFISDNLFNKKETCALDPCSFDGIYMPNLKDSFKHDLYAFSYFYDKFADPFNHENSFELRQMKHQADIVCGKSPQLLQAGLKEYEKNSDWCMDLGFMYSLLTVGYGLPETHIVKTTKKINGIEIGWCLGAAIQMIDNQQTDPDFAKCRV